MEAAASSAGCAFSISIFAPRSSRKRTRSQLAAAIVSAAEPAKCWKVVLVVPSGTSDPRKVTTAESRVFAVIEEGVPDGLRVDEFGNLWISSARGVEVFAPDGTALGIVHVPETVSNLCFGGPKNNRLFITATTSLYALFTAVRGAPRPTGI